MEKEIDLRPYLEALTRNWKWIIFPSLVLAVFVFMLRSVSPPVYEATVYVAITDSREIIQLDARIREEEQLQPSRAFPELAVSDAVLQLVLSKLGETTTDIKTINELRNMVEATLGDDIRLLLLKVSSSSEEEAAYIANMWAEQFVPWANQIFTTQDTTQLPLLEELLSEQEKELAMAEMSLIEFESRNRTRIISNTLAFQSTTQANYLQAQLEIDSLLTDAQRLHTQLQDSDDSVNSIAVADQLTSLLLQIKVLELYSDSAISIPFSLQISNVDSLTGQTREEQISYLTNLIGSLTTKLEEVEVQLANLEPKILESQRAFQQIKIESARLALKETLAREAYTALAYKVEEKRLTTESFPNSLRLVSRANVPEEPLGRGRLLAAAISLLLALIICCTFAVGKTWWRLNSQV